MATHLFAFNFDLPRGLPRLAFMWHKHFGLQTALDTGLSEQTGISCSLMHRPPNLPCSFCTPCPERMSDWLATGFGNCCPSWTTCTLNAAKVTVQSTLGKPSSGATSSPTERAAQVWAL